MGTKLVPDEKKATQVKEFLMTVQNPGAKVNLMDLLGGSASIHDLRGIFSVLDPLRDLLASELGATLRGWQPPQLVMIGQESSGKSTVLERLAMMAIFPRGDEICTRMPVHVRLRNVEQCQAATLEVYNKRDNITEEGPYIIPTETGAIDVREKMQEIVSKEDAAQNGHHQSGLAMDRVIIIKVSSPYVPSIDLIDLPGLVASPAANKESTMQLVKEHIKDHGEYSMYLATVKAGDSPNTSAAMEIVQSHKLQSKTVGVFTMCDELVPRTQQILMRHMEPNGKVDGMSLEPHGWVCVMNEYVDVGENGRNLARLSLQARNESDFFSERLQTLQEDRSGCASLVSRLQGLFVEFLRKDWGPKTVQMLKQASEDAQLENVRMGVPAFPATEIPKNVATVRRLAAQDATRRIQEASTVLMQKCATDVLSPLKDAVLNLAQPLQDVPLTAVHAQWKEQQVHVEAEVQKAVDLWDKHWLEGLKMALEARTPGPKVDKSGRVPDWQRSKRINSPKFELDRFPALVEAILDELQRLLQPAKKYIADAAQACTDKYYGELSPWVELKSNLTCNPATCTVIGQKTLLVEHILWGFIKVSTSTLLEDLPGKISDLCESIRDEAWVETCSEQRLELFERMKRLDTAKEQILHLLGVESVEELKFVKTRVVPGGAGQITVPSVYGVAVGPNGEIFATDGNDCVAVFRRDSEGSHELVRSFEGETVEPRGIAIDYEEEIIYVAYSGSDSISVFGIDGEHRNEFEANGPWGIALHDNRIFVSQTSGDIVVFSKLGVQEQSILSGQVVDPRGIAVDSDGTIYVASEGQHMVRAFSAAGTFIRQYGNGSASNANGSVHTPSDVCVDDEYVYVACLGNHSVQVFAKASSAFCRVIGTYQAGSSKSVGYSRGMLDTPAALCVDAAGKLLVCCESTVHLVPPPCRICSEVPALMHGVAVGPNGDIFATDHSSNRVVVLRRDTEGSHELVTSFGQDHLQGPRGIAIDYEEEIVYVASSANTISVFGMDGEHRNQFEVPNGPWGVALHGNRIFVSQHSGSVVQVFSKLGVQEQSILSGQVAHPRGIAVDSDGTIYVASQGHHMVRAFSAAGSFIRQYGDGSTSNSSGSVHTPSDVCVDDEYVYVACQGNHSVQVFAKASSAFCRDIGTYQANASQGSMQTPNSICIDGEGNLCVGCHSKLEILV